MILEAVRLDVRRSQGQAFEAAFATAEPIIMAMPGYLRHELRPCLEDEHRYLLLVYWRRLEDHVEGFRQSPQYQRWGALLHQFYDPFPVVEHYGPPLAEKPSSNSE